MELHGESGGTNEYCFGIYERCNFRVKSAILVNGFNLVVSIERNRIYHSHLFALFLLYCRAAKVEGSSNVPYAPKSMFGL